MSTSQQNMRLMKIAATAAIFGAMTLSGCKSSNEGTTTKESGKKTASKNNKRVSAVFKDDALTATIHSEERMEVKESIRKGTKVPFADYSATLTEEKYEASLAPLRSDFYFPTNTQSVAFYKDSPREIKIAEANKDPTSLKWGHMVAVNNEKKEIIESDAKVSNKTKFTYLVSYMDDNGDQKFVTLKRNQFLLDASTDSSANNTTKKVEYDAALVAKYHTDMQGFYNTKMPEFTAKMEAATAEITGGKAKIEEGATRKFGTNLSKDKFEIRDHWISPCNKVGEEFSVARNAFEERTFKDKRTDARMMVDARYSANIKNFDTNAAKKYQDMVTSVQREYLNAKTQCESAAKAAAAAAKQNESGK